MNKSYFHNAKKEDRLFDLALGYGYVVDVNHDRDEAYQWLKATFPNNGGNLIFNLDGGGHGRACRTLFYLEDYEKYIKPVLDKAIVEASIARS